MLERRPEPLRNARLAARDSVGRSRRRSSFARNGRGFTLFELLLVLALLVVMGALAYPAMRGAFGSQKLRKSAELVRTEWARARLKAMRTGRVHVFRFEPSAAAYQVETWASDADDLQSVNDFAPSSGSGDGAMRAIPPTQRTGELPEGIRFFGGETAVDGRASQVGDVGGVSLTGAGSPVPVLFYPDGTTSDAAVVLANDRQECIQVTLRALTGSSRVSDIMTVDEVFR